MVAVRSAWPPLERYVKDLVGAFAEPKHLTPAQNK